jgi:hypothetical protein
MTLLRLNEAGHVKDVLGVRRKTKIVDLHNPHAREGLVDPPRQRERGSREQQRRN